MIPSGFTGADRMASGVRNFGRTSRGDWLIAACSVTDPAYGARGDGRTDDSAAFQAALDRAGAQGGAVVFVPEGRYRIDQPLRIPANTTLRGTWRSPEAGGSGKGTILLAYPGRGLPEGTPFLSLATAASVMELSVWYPEQDPEAIVPYPWTIGFDGISCTVADVTLYNSWRGIDARRVNGSAQFVRGLYAAILDRGILFDRNLEFSLITRIRMGLAIWAESGLPGAPDTAALQEAIRSDTRSRAFGIEMGRNDDGWLHDIRIAPEDFLSGIRFFRSDPDEYGSLAGGTYGHALQLHDTTIRIEDLNTFGVPMDFLDDIVGLPPIEYIEPAPRRPRSDRLFVVTELPYGAKGDGHTDDTDAFEQALADAGAAGGGTVHVPAGRFVIRRPLVLPKGVELRGVYEQVHTAMPATASVLLLYSGKGETEGTPAFRLLRDAGLHGLTIRYPENDPEDPAAFPYTIRGEGDSVYVEHVTLLNAHQGIDFASFRCDGFLIRNVWGTCMAHGIRAGGQARGGRMDHVLMSYGIWLESGLRGTPGHEIVKGTYERNSIPYTFGALESFVGYSVLTHLTRNPIQLGNPDGSGPVDSVFLRLAMDMPTGRSCLDIRGGDRIRMVGIGTGANQVFLRESDSFRGHLDIFGQMAWGNGRNVLSGDRVRILNTGEALYLGRYPNLARSGLAEVSSRPFSGGSGAWEAVDGRRETAWVSGDPEGPHFLWVRLEEPHRLLAYRIMNEGARSGDPSLNTRDWILQASDDGSAWRDIDRVTGNGKDVVLRELAAPCTAAWFRLVAETPAQPGAGDGHPRLVDFQLYGIAESQAADLPSSVHPTWIAGPAALLLLAALFLVRSFLRRRPRTHQASGD